MNNVISGSIDSPGQFDGRYKSVMLMRQCCITSSEFLAPIEPQ